MKVEGNIDHLPILFIRSRSEISLVGGMFVLPIDGNLASTTSHVVALTPHLVI